MNLPDGILPGEWLVAAWVLFVPLILIAARCAPWQHLAEHSRLNVWLGTIVSLMLLWSLTAGIKPGLALHLVGAMLFSLAFGPWLAFIGSCLALAGITINGAAGWQSYAANALLMAGVGTLVGVRVLRFNERFLPPNLFVYLFANGFFGGAISMFAVGVAASAVLVLAGVYPGEYVLSEYLPYVAMLGFSEAWLSGMVLTLLVLYRPAWVCSFDDSRYLRD
jgi:uncharacterized membrane protein